MKKKSLLIISGLLLGSFAFTSCDTATGRGAGWGAATGAVLGAAVTGALIGASIDEEEALRYGPRPRGGFPFGRGTGTRGFYQSPYPPHQIYDLRGIPHGGLVEDRVGGGYFRKP
jgi:predicted small secreted protein